MLWLDSFKVSATLLLSKGLPEDSLMALVTLLLCFNIVQGFAFILFAEECLVLILFLEALLFNLL